MSSLADVFTTRIVDGIFNTPAGATEICIRNTAAIGGANITFEGNLAKITVNGNQEAVSSPAVIPPQTSVTLGYIGRGRKSITVNAVGGEADIEITL